MGYVLRHLHRSAFEAGAPSGSANAQPLCGKTCGRNLTVEGSARTGCGSCPQLAALGRSGTATFYGISGADEARAYLEHPLLGPRLLDCCKLLIQVHAGSARDVFGDIDAMKLRSSLTLFETVARTTPIFKECLDRYFGGERDPLTARLLAN